MFAPTAETAPAGRYRASSREQLTVADAVYPGVIACDANCTVADVARTMAAHRVRCVVITRLSRDPESRAWGLISDLDLIRAEMESPDQKAWLVAIRPVPTVEPDTPLLEASHLMLAYGAPQILVVDRKEQPIGVLSAVDVIGAIA
jgi:CBS domain-containing protein